MLEVELEYFVEDVPRDDEIVRDLGGGLTEFPVLQICGQLGPNPGRIAQVDDRRRTGNVAVGGGIPDRIEFIRTEPPRDGDGVGTAPALSA